MKNKLLVIVLVGLFSCHKDYLIKPRDNADGLNLQTSGIKNNSNILLCPDGIPDASIAMKATNGNLSSGFTFLFEIKNIGSGELSLDQVSFQTYLSKDGVLDASDISTGGSSLLTQTLVLEEGESILQSWFVPGGSNVDFVTNNNFILQLSIGQTECNPNNNIGVTPIPIDVPRNGLVALYPFNGNANDVTGNNLNGTVLGAVPATDRFGGANKSFQFNSINSINMGNPSLLQISNTITVSGWMNVSQFPPNHSPGHDAMDLITKIFNDPNVGGNPRKGFDLQQDFFGDGTPSMALAAYSSLNSVITSFTSLYVGGPTSTNTWIFFAMVIDGHSLKFYRDGLLTNDVTQPNNIMDDGSLGNLVIGSRFNGRIDDVAIYNRALSASEITQLFKQNFTK